LVDRRALFAFVAVRMYPPDPHFKDSASVVPDLIVLLHV
jgi:hypothetical protein